ncbi:MAG: M3 family metallopeptidase, partial [Myxococcota bacterium]
MPPAFDSLSAEHVVPGIRSLLGELGDELEGLEAALVVGTEPSWQGLVAVIEGMGDRLGHAWGIARHLLGVRNTDALREAYEAVQGEVVSFGLRLGQSRAIYSGLQRLREGAAWQECDAVQRRIVENLLRDARHAGVGLEGQERDRFNAIEKELAELATRFGNHLLDATRAFALTLRDPAEIEGLPESFRQLSAQAAREAGEKGADPDRGPWRVTLDAPSFLPFLEHSARRDLREQLYRAYVTRASCDPLDNTSVLTRMLELRREEAGLLGYGNYAELSLASKMAGGVDAVERLLEELREASYEAARSDQDELLAFARERGWPATEPFALWDVPFWAERLRQQRFDYSEEELRPYFPLSRVLQGLFELTGRLFGVEIRAADGEVPVWHPDVRFFRVREKGGEELAAFYLDPYSRPSEKRAGAWMDECIGRRCSGAGEAATPRLPVAYLVCNGTPPIDGKPSCMTFDEVVTLFHEFGHGLQHMLTTVDYVLAAGIRNIEWDAIELPSQFMENWCYQRAVMREISGHVESGEPIPDSLVEKVQAARTFRSGSLMLRQLYFAFTDMELHTRAQSGRGGSDDESPFEVQRRIAARTTVIPPLPEDRFLCQFSHIFGGGYAAGYYSYKWAEILSADAFAAFEEAGLDDREALAEAGRRYRTTILALGGSRAPMEVFKAFRGREPSTEALLRHAGLSGP